MRSVSHGVGGGDGPDQQQLERFHRRLSLPDNEVPRVLPVAAVVGRTDDAVVALIGVAAYTTGLSLEVVVRLRVRPNGLRRNAAPELTGGYGPAGGGALGLLLGLEFADGRTASTIGGERGWLPGSHQDDEPRLSPQGGGGSELSVNQSWWLTPLPPDGPLAVVCAFEAVGIGETRTELSQPWTTTGQQAQTLWPWQPQDDSPPPEPELPTTGWFAAHWTRDGG